MAIISKISRADGRGHTYFRTPSFRTSTTEKDIAVEVKQFLQQVRILVPAQHRQTANRTYAEPRQHVQRTVVEMNRNDFRV
ncbi:MAG: hypothetical protein IPO54_08995 [Micavibrio sp.]|nr:hypothetical protein [Micavibrio sp.]